MTLHYILKIITTQILHKQFGKHPQSTERALNVSLRNYYTNTEKWSKFRSNE